MNVPERSRAFPTRSRNVASRPAIHAFPLLWVAGTRERGNGGPGGGALFPWAALHAEAIR